MYRSQVFYIILTGEKKLGILVFKTGQCFRKAIKFYGEVYAPMKLNRFYWG